MTLLRWALWSDLHRENLASAIKAYAYTPSIITIPLGVTMLAKSFVLALFLPALLPSALLSGSSGPDQPGTIHLLSDLKPENLPIDGTFEQFDFSGDGTVIAIPNGYDVCVYNIGTFTKRCCVKPPHAGEYHFGCALNNAGDRLFVASGKNIFVYDTNSGNLLIKSDEICLDRLLALSPDGHFLATAPRESGSEKSIDGRVFHEGKFVSLWNTDNLKLVRTFDPVSNYIGGITFSSDGKRLLRIGHEGMQIWDVESGKLQYNNKTWMNGNPTWLEKSERVFGNGLVTKPAELLEIKTGKNNPTPQESNVFGNWVTALSPNHRVIVAGATYHHDNNGTPYLYLWDTKSGAIIFRIKGSKKGIISIRFSPDGRWLYACAPGKDGFMRWDLSKSKRLLPYFPKLGS